MFPIPEYATVFFSFYNWDIFQCRSVRWLVLEVENLELCKEYEAYYMLVTTTTTTQNKRTNEQRSK